MKFEALLFDLDGVVFLTEHHYTHFWASEGKRYCPEDNSLAKDIKGKSLKEILKDKFGKFENEHTKIVDRLDKFEETISFDYVLGLLDFLTHIRQNGIKTAIVTSSTQKKMNLVFKQHPELQSLIDTVITADNIVESKPSPQCYSMAARKLEVSPKNCVVFEDSFNGFKSGRNAMMTVVGLTTSNQESEIAPFVDKVIDNFLNYKDLLVFLTNFSNN